MEKEALLQERVESGDKEILCPKGPKNLKIRRKVPSSDEKPLRACVRPTKDKNHVAVVLLLCNDSIYWEMQLESGSINKRRPQIDLWVQAYRELHAVQQSP